MSAVQRDRLVLVVDDDETVRRVVRHVLEVDQFDVMEAASGREALEAVASNRPQSRNDLLAIPGIGPVKLERHGQALLDLVGRDEQADGGEPRDVSGAPTP